MKKISKAFLFLDAKNIDGYLHYFLRENYSMIFSSVSIIIIGEEKLRDCSSSNNLKYINFPMPVFNNFSRNNYGDCYKFGKRLTDLLLIYTDQTFDRDTLFIFHNSSLFFIASALKDRLDAKIVTFVDHSSSSNRFISNTYTKGPTKKNLSAKPGINNCQIEMQEDIIYKASSFVLGSNKSICNSIYKTYGLPKKKLKLLPYTYLTNTLGRSSKHKNLIDEVRITDQDLVIFINMTGETRLNQEKVLKQLTKMEHHIFILAGIVDLFNMPIHYQLKKNFKFLGELNSTELKYLSRECDIVLYQENERHYEYRLFELLANEIQVYFFNIKANPNDLSKQLSFLRSIKKNQNCITQTLCDNTVQKQRSTKAKLNSPNEASRIKRIFQTLKR
jgi:hypothetical protein